MVGSSRNEKSIGAALVDGSAKLSGRSKTPRLDAELLLAQVLGCTRLDLIARNGDILTQPQLDAFTELLVRRFEHEPIAYIRGEQEFWSLNLKVTPDVLIPRPDTERLVELALKFLAHLHSSRVRNSTGDTPLLILDLGTGSGCISIALSQELTKERIAHIIVATDKSVAALKVARDNFRAYGLLGSDVEAESSPCGRTMLFAGCWGEAIEGRFDLIVSNPPYVVRGAPGNSPEIGFEPESALFADDAGLAEVKEIATQAPRLLNAEGQLLCEIGAEQGQALRNLASYAPFSEFARCDIFQDLAQRDRVLLLSRVLSKAESASLAD